MNKTSIKSVENAQTLALHALSFLFSKEEALMSFISQAGLDPGEIRALAAQKHFQAAVLDFYLSDERLLLEFAQHEGIRPESIGKAAHTLGSGVWESEWA